MKTVAEISRMSDPAGTAYRPVHYIAAVCTALYMTEAIAWAARNGGATGREASPRAFYQKDRLRRPAWPGACNPRWADLDRQGPSRAPSRSISIAPKSPARPTATSAS